MNDDTDDTSTPCPEPTPDAKDDGSKPREKATREGDGLNPTRFGDWEMNGRCIDF